MYHMKTKGTPRMNGRIVLKGTTPGNVTATAMAMKYAAASQPVACLDRRFCSFTVRS